MTTQQAYMLLLLAVGALFVPLLSERIGLFAAPCEILYGTLVATFVPGVPRLDSFSADLGHFGLLLLLFLAGMEIDFELLRRKGASLVGRAAVAALGLQAICLLLGWVMGWPPITVLVVGAMSISVLLVVLREDGLHQSEFGQRLLIVGAIGEFFTILCLTGFDLVGRVGVGWPLVLAALKLLLLLLLGYAVLRGLSAAMQRRPDSFARLVSSGDPSEVGVRAALALMLAFAAVAVVLQIEQLLATFIAGAVCGYAFRGRNALTEKLATMGQGFFVPIFFITVGLGLRLGDVLHGAMLSHVLGLLLVLFLARLLAVPLLVCAGLRWEAALPAMLLLSAPLTLQVAIAQVGISLGQLDPTMHTAILAASILAALVFPVLARPLVPRGEPVAGEPLAEASPQPRRAGLALIQTHPLWPHAAGQGD
jgi:Kef-type K+ transport system membrane component KefB